MRKIYDAVIIGSGAAAYSAADWLFKENITDIAVITENRLWGTSRNTGSDKQTYYKISMDGFSQDSPYKMAEDLFSGGSTDGVKAYIQAVNSLRCFMRLYEYGVNFPRDNFGGFPGYKTDHDNTCRATSVGPLTSKIMTEKLEEKVLNGNGTPLLDNRQVIKILTDNNKAYGAVVLNRENDTFEIIEAKNIIAATGAPACMYEHSVFPESQHGMTGVLLEAGVRLCNFTQWQYGMSSTDFRWNVSGSFMQVIPRFVSVDKDGNEYEFLPESIGEKANDYVFLKGYQWPFSFGRMNESSKVDIAVYEQIQMGRQVYLDYTKNSADYCFEKLFDEGREYLLKTDSVADTPIERLEKLNSKAIDVYMNHGIDLHKDKLKIAVCAQHNNGGVDTDSNYESYVENLYVIGEAAGSFGLVRPGGSALNDTQVGGLMCARHIKNKKQEAIRDVSFEEEINKIENIFNNFTQDETVDYSFIKSRMSACAAFLRDKEECEKLLSEIRKILENYPTRHKDISSYFYDKDMLLSAEALLFAIIEEMPYTGSRGGAVFIENGVVKEENPDKRKFLTISDSTELYFDAVTKIPVTDLPFEKYLAESK
ncbi:MAG: FAD-binding protein [Clostridia bacterium]|nr:FAD-binding protein [Clostridia bacterium]